MKRTILRAGIAKKAFLGAIISCILTLSSISAWAFTTECSYYTKASCQREGTSGVFTSTGEMYDENALTCASRDFRPGTILKVTNLRNNRSIVVKCNDFGPNRKLHAKGRQLDLSAGAFRAIEDIKRGVCKVEVEVAQCSQ